MRMIITHFNVRLRIVHLNRELISSVYDFSMEVDLFDARWPAIFLLAVLATKNIGSERVTRLVRQLPSARQDLLGQGRQSLSQGLAERPGGFALRVDFNR